MGRHPIATFDDGLVAKVAADMDLRKPNRLALETIASEIAEAASDPWSGVADLATAVGKTYLAGALIDYLAQSDAAVRHFLIVVPNSTIYRKTIENLTSGHRKSILGGMTTQPVVITPDNFNAGWVAAALDDDTVVKVFVFTVQSLTAPTAEVTRRTRNEANENLGGSLYGRLQEAKDLIVLSDEHHMYAAKAKVYSRVLADLHAMAVIGLTATPDKSQTDQVVFQYPLAQAIADELVKTPVIVGRTDAHTDLDTRLRDGLLLLEAKKTAADAYADVTGATTVNPVMLVVAQDIDQAQDVTARLRDNDMLGSAEAVLEIHSEADDDQLTALADVEDLASPVRAIVSVQMLGVGWDVRNVYVICSLRKSVSEVLTEQTLGRGMRLPWGAYTGVELLDTVEVLAHERYPELLAKADTLLEGLVQAGVVESDKAAAAAARRRTREAKAAAREAAQAAAELAAAAAQPSDPPAEHSTSASGQNEALQSSQSGLRPDVANTDDRLAAAAQQNEALKDSVVAPRTNVTVTIPVVSTVETPAQFNLSALPEQPFADLGRRLAAGDEVSLLREVAGVTETGEGLKFTPRRAADALDASRPSFQPGAIANELRIAMIESNLVPSTSANAAAAKRLAGVIVEAAGGEAALVTQLPNCVSAVNALLATQHAPLAPSITYAVAMETFAPYRANIRPIITNRFGPFARSNAYSGWERGLHPVVWFDSKTERDAALILDSDSAVEVWVRLMIGDAPVKWRAGTYQPDFYVRTNGGENYLIEVKMNKELDSPVVLAKQQAANIWVQTVADAGDNGTWKYLLAPESVVAKSKTLDQLIRQSL